MGKRMKFISTPLKGAYVVEPEPLADERGFFMRTFCRKEFAEIGFDKEIAQINQSLTTQKGSIRGMHYQLPPAGEIKIIRCIRGAVFDVMVDLRAGSPTFLYWFSAELSRENMRMAYIPAGFAHGFQTLTDDAELIYHHSAFYSPECEQGLRYDDPALDIQWPLPVSAVSPKDRGYPLIHGFRGISL